MPILSAKEIYMEIYRLLWTKTDRRKEKIFPFFVPDTVFFIDDLPHTWIFTSKKDGIIKKKNASKLKNSEIISSFKKGSQQVVAYYFYCSDENKKVEYVVTGEAEKIERLNLIEEYLSRLGINFEEEKKKKSANLLFEIIERPRLEDFLNNTKKRYGILQKYKETSDIYNYMFRIMWSPQFSICDIRKARQPVASKNYHTYEKIITFETQKFHINTGNISVT
jgi:hypothetical protein